MNSISTSDGPDPAIAFPWQDHRVVQLAWLGFAIAAVISAWQGLVPYLQRVPIPCDGHPLHCLAIQISSDQMNRVIANGVVIRSEDAWIDMLVTIFAAVVALLLAAFGMWRRPTSPVVICMSFVFVALGAGEFVYALAQEEPVFHLLAAVLRGVYVIGLPLCFILINPSADEPTVSARGTSGRFPPWRLRRDVLVPHGSLQSIWLKMGALLVATFGLLVAFAPVPPFVTTLFATVALVLCGGTLLHRYRRAPSSSPQREQLVWAIMAYVLLIGTQIIGRPIRPIPFVAVDIQDPFLLGGVLATTGFTVFVGGMACLAVALLRDELTQLELVFNRTLVYGLLTLIVICTYGLIVGSLSMIFQAAGSFWLSLIATGLVAVLFQPLREWVQRLANHLLYGQRDDPIAVLTHLGKRLEEVQTADELLPDIAMTIGQALKLPYVAIAVHHAGATMPVAEFTTLPVGRTAYPVHTLTIPMIHQRETLGELRVAYRSPDDPFSALERELLMNIARQASAAVRAVQLTSDLRQSHQQLISVVEEERRRLRRDLHDGLGPVMAALILQSETARDLVRRDPEEAEDLLESMADQAQTATQEIRRLVYDLRPPALDDLGLTQALLTLMNRYAYSGVQFEIDFSEPLPALPAAVEVALYRIVTEALTNVVRHAHATHCWVTLDVNPSLLVLTVRDDGQGLPFGAQIGVGIISMRERCTELGGSFVMHGQNGVEIQATLPF